MLVEYSYGGYADIGVYFLIVLRVCSFCMYILPTFNCNYLCFRFCGLVWFVLFVVLFILSLLCIAVLVLLDFGFVCFSVLGCGLIACGVFCVYCGFVV